LWLIRRAKRGRGRGFRPFSPLSSPIRSQEDFPDPIVCATRALTSVSLMSLPFKASFLTSPPIDVTQPEGNSLLVSAAPGGFPPVESTGAPLACIRRGLRGDTEAVQESLVLSLVASGGDHFPQNGPRERARSYILIPMSPVLRRKSPHSAVYGVFFFRGTPWCQGWSPPQAIPPLPPSTPASFFPVCNPLRAFFSDSFSRESRLWAHLPPCEKGEWGRVSPSLFTAQSFSVFFMRRVFAIPKICVPKLRNVLW